MYAVHGLEHNNTSFFFLDSGDRFTFFFLFCFFMIFVLFIDLRGMRLKMEVLKTEIQLIILARRGGPYPSGHNLNLMILMFCRYGSCKREIDEIGKEQPLIKSSFKS